MQADRFNSAYRTALIIAVLYALWMFFPHVSGYANHTSATPSFE